MPNPPTPSTSSRRHSRNTVPAGNALLLYALFIAGCPRPTKVCKIKSHTRYSIASLPAIGDARGQAMSFDCVSRTHVGLRRKVNEDSIFERTERGLWAVADGMGGHEAGDVASAKVVEAFRSLPIVYGLDELVEAAIDALYGVNRELIELAQSGGHAR